MKRTVFILLALGMVVSACASTASQSQALRTAKENLIGADTALTQAQALIDQRRYEEADAILQSLVKTGFERADLKLAMAECALGRGKPDQAEPIFSTLANDPQMRAKALQGLGIIMVRRGESDQAISLLAEAARTDRSLWRAWNALAQAYDFRHQWADSKAAYDQALQSAPNGAVIRNNLGMSYLAQKRYDEALEAFQQSRVLDPALKAAETNYQLTLALQRRFPEALYASHSGDKSRLLNNAGYVALVQGDYDHAEELFTQAAEASPLYYAPAYENLQLLQRLRARNDHGSS